MMNAKDWRDIEINFHWMVEDFSDEDGWYIHLGGGRHSNPQPYCEGCSYIFKMFFNGDVQWLKEQWHNSKAPVPFEDSINTMPPMGNYLGGSGIIEGAIGGPNGEFRGNWNLMKFCRYNVKQNDGKNAVKIEVYMNTTGDKQTWTLLTDILDNGGWGTEDAECNGAPDQIMNWGFPMVRFTWENAENISWFGLSIREIITTTPIPEDPDDEEEPGGGGQPGTPEQTTGKVSKIGSFRFSIASTLATSCDGVEPTTPPTDPDPPPPGGGPDPPPPAGGVLSFKLAEYFRVGAP